MQNILYLGIAIENLKQQNIQNKHIEHITNYSRLGKCGEVRPALTNIDLLWSSTSPSAEREGFRT
jgi:hypothetical protein